MKRAILIAIALMLTAGISAQDAEKGKKEKVKEPEITFENVVYDYGMINKGADGTCEFRFKNTGKEDLILSRVHPSCGCTALDDWPKEPIKKNKTGTIKVKYNNMHIVGPFQKTITVESNAVNNRVTLTIKGNVVEPPREAAPVNSQSPIVTPQ
ncbi:MAG: DUF1573 domain-containing protein [Bacteroidales bacterium]|jgi:hypothetical protein|nr:DUF1573 domain-containing protein [Bacteroidales bacterium]